MTGTEVATTNGGRMIAVGASILDDTARFEHAWRIAGVFSASQLVPAHLRGKREDCLIALHMAQRLDEDPLIIMQNIVVISGKPGWLTQYMIARANRSGIFRGRITWSAKGSGETLLVTAKATLADTGETVDASADMKMAKAEGWTKNPKYQSMAEHMLRYRSATMLIRLYCPEVMLGMQTSDELEDMRAAGQMRDITPPHEALPTDADAFERAAAGVQEPPPPSEDDLEAFRNKSSTHWDLTPSRPVDPDPQAQPAADPLDIPPEMDRRETRSPVEWAKSAETLKANLHNCRSIEAYRTLTKSQMWINTLSAMNAAGVTDRANEVAEAQEAKRLELEQADG